MKHLKNESYMSFLGNKAQKAVFLQPWTKIMRKYSVVPKNLPLPPPPPKTMLHEP